MENKNINEPENISLENSEVSTEDVIEEMMSQGKKPKKKKEKKGTLKKLLTSRKTKRGSVAAAITVVFVCIILLLNMITGILVDKFPSLEFDFTSQGSYELQKDTVEYLSKIDREITIYALAKEDTFKNGMGASKGSEYAIQGYKQLKKMAASNSKISLKFIELSSNPTFVNKYDKVNWQGTSSNNFILLDAGNDDYSVLSLDECFTYDEETLSYYGTLEFTATTMEQAVVTGILDITTGVKIGVDFIKGLGETESDYTALVNLLKKNAYDIKSISLTTEKLRKDSKIAVLYGPTVDLSEEASEKLSDWLENDGDYGRSLIYVPVNTQVETPNINALMEQYGMKVTDGISYCTNPSYYINSPYCFLSDYESDIYTASLKNSSIPVIVGNSRAVEITNDDIAKSLLKVEKSVGVLPFDVDLSKIKTENDLKKYSKDSINLACVGTKTNEESKSVNVAVFASYEMFSAPYLNTTTFNNANYIINFCNTVTDRGDMGITITSAGASIPELGTITEGTMNIMFMIFTIIVPVVILAIGLVVFIRRRNK